MRTGIEFKTESGAVLRGWHYRPGNGGGSWPTIVMAHKYSAVKEMDLDGFAEVFADAGLAAIVFDNRNSGARESEPRQEIIRGNRSMTTATRSASPRASLKPSGSASGAHGGEDALGPERPQDGEPRPVAANAMVP